MAMRVLHVDTGAEWRGGQRQLFLLVQGLREMEYEPLVVARPSSPIAERLRALGGAVATTPMRGAWDLPAARRIRTLLRTWRPDVVHAHDSRAHALLLAALSGDLATPLVVTRRTAARPTALGLEHGGRVARYVAIARAVRTALTEGGIDPVLIDVVPPGIELPHEVTSRDWRAELGWPQDAIVCGVVGAMTSERRLRTLARIAAALPETARARVRLVLLGGRGTGRVSIGGLEAHHVGFVEGGLEALAGLDVLWHPSSRLGLGTTALDAMALGVVPVAFATGALPELITHEGTGMLVPPGDAHAFAAAVARLVEDDRLRRILAAQGPARAARFEARQMVRAYDRVYRSLRRGPSTAAPDER